MPKPKDYYAILGIPAGASQDEVKAAYRRRAMEHHPDRTGAECGPFQDLQEAYAVLSDPEARRGYDSEQENVEREPEPWRRPTEPLRSWGTTIEIPVRPEEAREGGRVRLVLPRFMTCPTCGGWGTISFYLCRGCRGEGMIAEDYTIEVGFPPGIVSSHSVRLPLFKTGRGRALTVLFTVR